MEFIEAMAHTWCWQETATWWADRSATNWSHFVSIVCSRTTKGQQCKVTCVWRGVIQIGRSPTSVSQSSAQRHDRMWNSLSAIFRRLIAMQILSLILPFMQESPPHDAAVNDAVKKSLYAAKIPSSTDIYKRPYGAFSWIGCGWSATCPDTLSPSCAPQERLNRPILAVVISLIHKTLRQMGQATMYVRTFMTFKDVIDTNIRPPLPPMASLFLTIFMFPLVQATVRNTLT